MIQRNSLVGAALALAITMPATLRAQENYTVRGDAVSVYNLAGEVEVVGGSGSAVTVSVTRGGADAGDLDVQVGEIRGRQSLRVIYPADRISYDARGWGGNTDIRVRRDGTWGGDDDWRSRGDRVRISSRGGGMDAHADLRIEVPRGRDVQIYLAVGRITASNVDGRVLLDTHSGSVDARSMAGNLNVDTGSGSVTVAGMEGSLLVDTGSGSVDISEVTGDDVILDTGSGGVDADRVTARRIDIDTGSGGIRLLGSAAPNVRLDTGSGSVRAELASNVDRLVVDTGSGSVTLFLPEDLSAEIDIETGSGGIDVEFPVLTTHRARDELHGRIGDGSGRIVIDTGSGGVHIRRMR